MDILASSLGENLEHMWSQWVWPALLLLVGVGLVIFVHELGHFLMAKAVRIKVQRFSLGFGWRVFGIKIGETDYSIGALPLGGYVKMLGQEDFSHLEETGAPPDPRSYAAKSVGARMAVISAGVVMNIIFAAILFVVICLIGKRYPAPVVGGVTADFPASKAEIVWQESPGAATTPPASEGGLRPGDRILSIEGDSWVLNLVGMPVTRFSDIRMIATIADTDDQFLFTIEREADGRKQIGTTGLGVKQTRKGLLAFGIIPALSNTIRALKGVIADTPFKDGDVVVAINGQPVQYHWDIEAFSETLDGAPVTVTVQRKDREKIFTREITISPTLEDSHRIFWLKDGRRIRGEVVAQRWNKEEKLTYYDVRAEDGSQTTICETDIRQPLLEMLGMTPRLRVATVIEGGPAHKSGLKPGDIIVLYGDDDLPTHGDLRRITEKVVGKKTSITVRRGKEKHTYDIIPRMRKGGKERRDRAVIDIALGLDLAECVVAGVRKGSVADKAGIVEGATITAVNGKAVESWLDVYEALKDQAGKDVSIDFSYGSEQGTGRIGKLTPENFDPADYQFSIFQADGVGFDLLSVRIVKTNPVAAVGWGCEETVKMVLTAYLSLRSIVRGTVPVGAASGPVGIGSIAIRAARQGVLDFVYLIAFLSAVIAVFNFLPLPVLDGGHAVLLIIEKIRRKPLSARALNIVQTVGMVLILCIFVAVTFNDIKKILEGSL